MLRGHTRKEGEWLPRALLHSSQRSLFTYVTATCVGRRIAESIALNNVYALRGGEIDARKGSDHGYVGQPHIYDPPVTAIMVMSIGIYKTSCTIQ